jgi:hypothetical protein
MRSPRTGPPRLPKLRFLQESADSHHQRSGLSPLPITHLPETMRIAGDEIRDPLGLGEAIASTLKALERNSGNHSCAFPNKNILWST